MGSSIGPLAHRVCIAATAQFERAPDAKYILGIRRVAQVSRFSRPGIPQSSQAWDFSYHPPFRRGREKGGAPGRRALAGGGARATCERGREASVPTSRKRREKWGTQCSLSSWVAGLHARSLAPLVKARGLGMTARRASHPRPGGFHGRLSVGFFFLYHPFTDDWNRIGSLNTHFSQKRREMGHPTLRLAARVIMFDLSPGLTSGAALFRSSGAGSTVGYFVCSP
jgi:hypothetical protein